MLDSDRLLVKREWTSKKILKILNFYEKSDFPHRPKIIDYKIDDSKSYLLENFIEGDILKQPIYESLQLLVQSLIDLYKDTSIKANIKRYCNHEFIQKLKSLPPCNHEEISVIYAIFNEFFKLLPEDTNVSLTQIHWDLKGDNIILHEGKTVLIDWEWNKIGHFVQDLQKFIETTLHYNPAQTDLFLNAFFMHKNISRQEFLWLECFYFFLNQTLQLSKKRLSLENFRRKNKEKIDRMINSKLYELNLHGKKIKIWSISPLSSIFEWKNELPPNEMIKIISTGSATDNQTQRIIVNKHLMMEYRDFITLHGAAFQLVNGKIIVLTGKSGSGKSYILKKLIEKGGIQKVFDEDMVNLEKDWTLFGLADQNFKGYHNNEYLYQKDDFNTFWSLDIILFIDPQADKEIIPLPSPAIETCIHEQLSFDKALIEYYKTFPFPPWIKSYKIKNTYNHENFTWLLSYLWTNL